MDTDVSIDEDVSALLLQSALSAANPHKNLK
jgi:hypothetical protein